RAVRGDRLERRAGMMHPNSEARGRERERDSLADAICELLPAADDVRVLAIGDAMIALEITPASPAYMVGRKMERRRAALYAARSADESRAFRALVARLWPS